MAKRRSETGFNRHRAARVLVDAALTSDAAAARAHGVHASSVAAWRRRLNTDPELAGLFADMLERADGEWLEKLRRVVTEGARVQLEGLQQLGQRIGQASELPDLLDVLRAAQDATRTAAETLITYESLVVTDDGPHDRPDPRPPTTAGSDREGAAPTTH